jgi:hypothetical protein
MDSGSNRADRKRKVKEGELESHKDRRNTLEFELVELRQTRQDTAGVLERLATVRAEIAKLEDELRQL